FFVGVINIILDFILIPKYTLIGAACANTTSQLLGCIIGLWWLYTVFKIKIPLGNFITSFIVAIFIIMSAKSVFTISNFFQLFLYFFIYYVLCITIFIFLKQITINEIKIIVCRKKF
ncbi:MAG: polysaccharide biosynthesis C-terminal domain-containing protein, partial [Endomicrobia bacterium]|nr:polysaccharide biosynthesis C-terminal domain-containing protein [Endomicrobiia bacterium]